MIKASGANVRGLRTVADQMRYKIKQKFPGQPTPQWREITCHIPFKQLHIYEGGVVSNCCTSWLPKSLGNVNHSSLLQILESENQAQIRSSVLDGSFRYCRRDTCPHLVSYATDGVPKGDLLPIEKSAKLIANFPISIFLNYDKSCNLWCESCRNSKIMHSKDATPADLLRTHERVMASVTELLREGYQVKLNVTGSGDPFASPLYSSMLNSLPDDPQLQIALQTNGVAMRESVWTPNVRSRVVSVSVSIDAAREETYRKVRRGGLWPTLMKNLSSLDQMMRSGLFPKLTLFQVNFVVQADNYQEIPDFISLALNFPSINCVWFNLILDWGHLPGSSFKQKAIWMTAHPEHELFLRRLEHPLLRHPIVNLGNLAPFVSNQGSRRSFEFQRSHV